MQLLARELGGDVQGAEVGEFGRSQLTVTEPGRLLAGLPAEQTCWMSHRDTVFAPPPGLHRAGLVERVAGRGAGGGRARHLRDPVPPRGRPHALRAAHPHDASSRTSAAASARGAPASIIDEQIARIRAQVGDGRVICGLSGGVDSSVAALLVHRAIGDQLTCVFVDHGLMRKNEGEQVIAAFRDHFKVPLVAVDAEDRFLDAAARASPSPRRSARRSARSSSASSRRRRRKLGDARASSCRARSTRT